MQHAGIEPEQNAQDPLELLDEDELLLEEELDEDELLDDDELDEDELLLELEEELEVGQVGAPPNPH